ncbi:MAG: sulfite exporter TauE/SafE family protein [Candidatus Omnitrophica bacterium]|nr:sulfite exporter TauE/SafE family protein [Candidatus Omnitrophota bacterium]
MLEGAVLLVSAVVAGILGGLLGIGGGVIIMPVLCFIFGISTPFAAGTTALAVFFTTLSGGYKHIKLGHVDIKSLVPIMAAGAVSTTFFSYLFIFIARKPIWLELGIGCVFLFISLRMICEGISRVKEKQGLSDKSIRGMRIAKIFVGAVSGMLPGLFGIGTGAVLVPAFNYCLNSPIKVAIGSSLVCFAVNAFISSAFKFFQGFVLLDKALILCAGTVIGAYVGARLNKEFPPSLLKLLFGLVFLYVSLKYIFLFWGVKV